MIFEIFSPEMAKFKFTEFNLNIHQNLFLIKSDQLSTSLSDQKVTDCEDRHHFLGPINISVILRIPEFSTF